MKLRAAVCAAHTPSIPPPRQVCAGDFRALVEFVADSRRDAIVFAGADP
ncbi:hypothetical protein [Nannocystis pusilla]